MEIDIAIKQWNHSICDKCWNAREPNRQPVRLRFAVTEICCFCKETSSSGIHVSMNPLFAPCKGEHDG